MPFLQFGNIGIEKIPGIATRGIENDSRLERRSVVEASDVDADHVGHLFRLVVDRDAADRAKALSLGSAPVTGSRDFANFAGYFQRLAREDEHRTVSAAGIILPIPPLPLTPPNPLAPTVVPHRTP